jgi:hypothetical protein
MARCAHCNKFILGGKKQGALRFCNDECHQRGFLAPMAERAAPEQIAERIRQLHQQQCPICGGDGPVDVCTSHLAWSYLIRTSWKDRSQLSCASCGKKAIWKGLAITSLFGWWGFPFGLVATPWQLLNGIKSLRKLPAASRPSDALQHMVKLQVASQITRLHDGEN